MSGPELKSETGGAGMPAGKATVGVARGPKVAGRVNGPIVRPGLSAPPAAAVKYGPMAFEPLDRTAGHRVLLYGPGGIGKTTLAASAPGPVAFIDLDDSLSRLNPAGDVRKVGGVTTWASLMGVLRSDGWAGIRTIVIDTGTRAEELSIAHTIEHVRGDKGQAVSSIEGYGFGKGLTYNFDTFLPLLAVLDRHSREGRHVVMICHDCSSPVPNPAGEDWLRYEPRMQSPGSGKASIRLRVREWADHVLFFGYDVSVVEGKGRGVGTRTIYPAELPFCMAKSRTCQTPFAVEQVGADDIWSAVFGQA